MRLTFCTLDLTLWLGVVEDPRMNGMELMSRWKCLPSLLDVSKVRLCCELRRFFLPVRLLLFVRFSFSTWRIRQCWSCKRRKFRSASCSWSSIDVRFSFGFNVELEISLTKSWKLVSALCKENVFVSVGEKLDLSCGSTNFSFVLQRLYSQRQVLERSEKLIPIRFGQRSCSRKGERWSQRLIHTIHVRLVRWVFVEGKLWVVATGVCRWLIVH